MAHARQAEAEALVAGSNDKPGTMGHHEFRECFKCGERRLFTFQDNYGNTTVCFNCGYENYFSLGD